jgi:hypothetical protein
MVLRLGQFIDGSGAHRWYIRLLNIIEMMASGMAAAVLNIL